MSAAEDDDDVPRLSEHALQALREFLAENAQRQGDPTNVEEDWQLSQFWYSDETAEALATEVMRVCGENGRIACISCPTLYRKLRELQCSSEMKLLEFDERFSCFGDDFVFYDCNSPLNVPENVRFFTVVIADPPFLSAECLEKVSQTVRLISPKYIILCTGTVMEPLAKKFLGLEPCKFRPTHARKLGNEFMCFANYDLDEFCR